jgi:CHAT domain-containing protein
VGLENIFFARIDSFRLSLHNISDQQKYNGAGLSAALFQSLIAPLQNKLSGMERLIIVPEDELNYLPFEALQDGNKKYLVEKYSVQYQYSTSLLLKKDRFLTSNQTLAFAPFVSKEYLDTGNLRLSSLPASKEEVSHLKGKIFTDSIATKNNFLREAGHYSTIHLATHATVNNNQPLRSYIAFYPADNDPENFRLYAQEIYDLNLDSTQLIILSACETGTGRLVKGEGLMSLSRAFSYAGCSNIITSLWKAEDKTTAYITQRLHHYLDKGISKDKALQQAKLDLLNSHEIDPRYKTPNYWAHLIFIGNYETTRFTPAWWPIAIVIIISTTIYLFVKQKAWLRTTRPSSS